MDGIILLFSFKSLQLELEIVCMRYAAFCSKPHPLCENPLVALHTDSSLVDRSCWVSSLWISLYNYENNVFVMSSLWIPLKYLWYVFPVLSCKYWKVGGLRADWRDHAGIDFESEWSLFFYPSSCMALWFNLLAVSRSIDILVLFTDWYSLISLRPIFINGYLCLPHRVSGSMLCIMCTVLRCILCYSL